MPALSEDRYLEQSAVRMDGAREALLGGKTSTLAYSVAVGEADVERVGGVSSDQLGGSRRPRRPTPSV